MGALLPIILQLIGGGAGGNILGSLVKGSSLGTTGNTIAGALGGLGGMQVLGPLLGLGAAVGGGGTDIVSILASLVGGGVSGGVVQLIVGLIKNRMA